MKNNLFMKQIRDNPYGHVHLPAEQNVLKPSSLDCFFLAIKYSNHFAEVKARGADELRSNQERR